MRNKFNNYIYVSILSIILFVGFPTYAADEDSAIGFTVEAVQPKTQIDETKTYYYVKTNPDESQKLSVKIKNTQKEPVQLKMFIADATTSPEGTIRYKEGIADKDETLLYSMEDIASTDEEVFTVGPEEIVTIEIMITPPKENYEGVILGAVYVQKVDEEESNAGISSSYSYRLGIMMSESDEDFANAKNFELNKVTPIVNRNRKTITANLQNKDPKLLRDLSLKGEVIDAKTNKVLKTQTMENGAVAPNSNFDWAIDWGLDPVKQGDYILKVAAKSDKEVWSWEEKFTISDEQAKKMNEEALFKLSLPIFYIIAIAILALVMIVVTVILILRQKKWKTLKKKKKSGKQKKHNK